MNSFFFFVKGFTGRQCETEIIYTPTPTAKITLRKTATPVSTPTNIRPSCAHIDNCSAHFTCNSNGSVECLTGWSGDTCNQLIPDSVADCTVYDCKRFEIKQNLLTLYSLS